MIYRVHLYDDADGSEGFAYSTSKREAEKTLRAWRADAPNTRGAADIDTAPTPRTVAGIMRLLQQWGSHADNG